MLGETRTKMRRVRINSRLETRNPARCRLVQKGFLSFTAACALLFAPVRASPQELRRIHYGTTTSTAHLPIWVAKDAGFFARNGLDIESIAVSGDARKQQAIASDSSELALGAGPAMALIVKGAPIKGVAALAGPPLVVAHVVRPDGPKSAAHHKGKKISV